MSKQNNWIICLSIVVTMISPCRADEPSLFLQDDMEKVRKITGYDDYVKNRIEMSYDEAKKKWGEKPFDAQKFKTASWKDRAPMAVDLLNRKKIFLGKTLTETKEILGRHDGFFWRDNIPAYIVEDGLNVRKKSWQIVFLAGMDRKIADIRIYQN